MKRFSTRCRIVRFVNSNHYFTFYFFLAIKRRFKFYWVASKKLVPFKKKVAEKLGKFYQSIEVMSFFLKIIKGHKGAWRRNTWDLSLFLSYLIKSKTKINKIKLDYGMVSSSVYVVWIWTRCVKVYFRGLQHL